MKITKTNDLGQHALKMVIYGEAGSGKTRLAATTGEPTVVISAEGGLLSLRDHAITAIEVKTIADVGEELGRRVADRALGLTDIQSVRGQRVSVTWPAADESPQYTVTVEPSKRGPSWVYAAFNAHHVIVPDEPESDGQFDLAPMMQRGFADARAQSTIAMEKILAGLSEGRGG